ncbi:RNA polymerase sigma factor SigJ [Microbacterium sp. EST19A]|uniref:RNA polymerase sigma factor SigJ n=1 Tax=Microbacterium sp. EST19A TaxID=2862681 RepID=UPI001CBFE387|nr:RNA polymerase sigma factor SigJ [Microbacterium sp. EST19A]
MHPEDDLTLTEVLGERQHLLNVSFRMLGTAADAEDAVQETYVRWFRMSDDERSLIRAPRGWLTRVVGNVCLDMLGSARHRREEYVGEWLPEPLSPDSPWESPSEDPLDRLSEHESISMALLVMLESLTPAERVAFILHDVFAMPFDEIADIVGRTSQACRKLASTARRHIDERREQVTPVDQHDAIVREFWTACGSGDLTELVRLLDPNVVTLVDGGGRVRAALKPIRGADNVSRFLLGVVGRQDAIETRVESVNGRSGLVFRHQGVVVTVASFEMRAGLITDLWLTLNPDKLRTWNKS